MHIEFRHLRTIRAIHEAGSLGRAAEGLGITQSALSHQIRYLEDQAGVPLFVRRSKPMTLSAAGRRLLAAAERILPEVAALEAEFAGIAEGSRGRLTLAIECHACFDWLFAVLGQFRHAWPEVDVDIRPGLAFDALPALMREEVDLVISSDPEDLPGALFLPLFDYAPVLVCAAGHPLAAKDHVAPADLHGETLIHYPVPRARLDAFTAFMDPSGIEPRDTRAVELTAMILLLVAAGRGVAVLPDWVVRGAKDVAVRPLGPQPIRRRLYAAIREGEERRPFMAQFVRLSRTEPVKDMRPA